LAPKERYAAVTREDRHEAVERDLHELKENCFCEKRIASVKRGQHQHLSREICSCGKRPACTERVWPLSKEANINIYEERLTSWKEGYIHKKRLVCIQERPAFMTCDVHQ